MLFNLPTNCVYNRNQQDSIYALKNTYIICDANNSYLVAMSA